MRPILFICTGALSGLLMAAHSRSQAPSPATNPDNSCHDESVADDWSRMLSESPRDPIVIRLYGLRVGLCSLVDRGQVGLNQAAEIWELTRAEAAMQRFKDEAESNPKLSL